jgi:predicted Zn-dependent protease
VNLTLARLSCGCALVAAAIALAASCTPDTPERCFEPDAASYGFSDPADPGASFRWARADYPVRVYAEPVGELQQHAGNAISLWLGAFRCGELGLTTWSDSNTADIVLRNPPLEPPRAATARAIAADSINACRGRTDLETPTTSADTILRPVRSYVWPVGTDQAATDACYRFVAAHELGHALGLLRHSLDTLDIMYQRPRRAALSLNDRYTIQLLYNTAPTLVAAPR